MASTEQYLSFRNSDGFGHGCRIDVTAPYDVMNSQCDKNLRWAFRLFGLDQDLVACDALVLLTAKNCNHVERRAACQRGSDQFNWLRTRAACEIIDEKIVTTARFDRKLPAIGLSWLRKRHSSANDRRVGTSFAQFPKLIPNFPCLTCCFQHGVSHSRSFSRQNQASIH